MTGSERAQDFGGSRPAERLFERYALLNQIRYVLARRQFSTRRARSRAFWHYIIRRHRWEICGDCGRPVARSTGSWWAAPDDLWTEVNGSPFGVLCPPCFTGRAAALGIPIRWEAVRDAE